MCQRKNKKNKRTVAFSWYQVMKKYQTIEKNDEFIIINLQEPL